MEDYLLTKSVCRGSCCSDSSAIYPASLRSIYNSSGNVDGGVGFRVALYIK